MPDSRNIVKKSQPMRWVDGQRFEKTYEDGRVGEMAVLVPDTEWAYGDDNSLIHITEDLVGKHSGSDAVARKAGERARQQLQTTDYNAERRRMAAQRWLRGKPSVAMYEDVDNAGVIRGYLVQFVSTDPKTGLTTPSQRYITIEQAMAAAGQ